jgi:hypothetical protein
MKTDDLIDQLATELKAVQPLKPPLSRASVWMLGSVLYMTALAFIVTQAGIAEVGIGLGLFLSQLIGLVAGVAAAIAAFATVVPGYSRRVLIWPAIAIAGWLAVFIVGAINGDPGAGIAASTHEWVCVGMIVIGGLPLIAVLATMLRRGAPMSPGLTGLLGALAVGLFANFIACVSLPHESFLVTLSWHGGALALLALIGIVGSRVLLRWDAPPERHRGVQ